MLCNCSNCGKQLNKKPYHIKKYKNLYCNHTCKNKHQQSGFNTNCGTCKKPLYKKNHQAKKSTSGKHFCGRSCSAKHRNRFIKGERHVNYKNGKWNYREKALTFYGHKCQNKDCILSKIIKIPVHMLDVDHIDENRNNNKIENLKVLCVWCHALKTRRHWAKTPVD